MSLVHIISPNASICAAISEQLRAGGVWRVVGFEKLAVAVSSWGEALPLAIFLDDGAIDKNLGRMIEVAGLGAASNQISPMLFVLGNAGDALDKAIITESFSKPLRLGYIIARLGFYNHLQQLSPDVEFALGAWQFLPRKKLLTHRATGKQVKLTDKESGLLEFLRQAEKPMPRDEILASVWGYGGEIDTHTLETHIYSLRRKLSFNSDDCDIFVVGQGNYRINPAWLA